MKVSVYYEEVSNYVEKHYLGMLVNQSKTT